MSVDWSDPCARARALSDAYYALLSGNQETRVRTRKGESEDDVEYARADINTLRVEMQAAQAECARATGQPHPRRRFAIQAGSRGGPWGCP